MANAPELLKPVKAFVSCSLREEDQSFNSFVEGILRRNNIEPFGTVGKHSAAPESVAESMRKNIPEADMVVIIATPRYLQQDLKTGKLSHGLSEMVHVETGMAFALKKPVVVFVQKGTNIGNFLPGITQYIELEGAAVELDGKKDLIGKLLETALTFIKGIKQKQDASAWQRFVLWVLAIYGGYKLLRKLFR
jgi:hypothetical protein